METEIEHLRRCNAIMKKQMKFVFSEVNNVLKKIYNELNNTKYGPEYDDLKELILFYTMKFDTDFEKIAKETKEELGE